MPSEPRELSREAAQVDEDLANREPNPGEITGPAQGALRGDPREAAQLYAVTAPRLRAVARRHLRNAGGQLDLTPDEIAGLTIQEFMGTADFDLRSREDFFAYAHRFAARVIELAAKGRLQGTDLLLDTSRKLRDQAVLGQVIRQIDRDSSKLGHVLQSRYVLGLRPADLVVLDGEPESAVTDRWTSAEAALRYEYRKQEAMEETSPSLLDLEAPKVYPAPESPQPENLPDEFESPPPAAESLDSLRQDNAQLRSELAAAHERIATLESELSTASDLHFASSRADLEALLLPPDLAPVPLFSGNTSEELFRHLEEQYGQWLTHFGAEQDQVSLDLLRRHDPQFVDKLSQRISRIRRRERQEYGEPRTPTLGEIMPTEATRGDLALTGRLVEELFEPANRGLAALVSGRLRRHLFGK